MLSTIFMNIFVISRFLDTCVYHVYPFSTHCLILRETKFKQSIAQLVLVAILLETMFRPCLIAELGRGPGLPELISKQSIAQYVLSLYSNTIA